MPHTYPHSIRPGQIGLFVESALGSAESFILPYTTVTPRTRGTYKKVPNLHSLVTLPDGDSTIGYWG